MCEFAITDLFNKKEKSFSKEFKLEAARRAESSNSPRTRIADELGIFGVTLYKWCKLHQMNHSQVFHDTGPTIDQQKFKNLQLELERVKRSSR